MTLHVFGCRKQIQRWCASCALSPSRKDSSPTCWGHLPYSTFSNQNTGVSGSVALSCCPRKHFSQRVSYTKPNPYMPDHFGLTGAILEAHQSTWLSESQPSILLCSFLPNSIPMASADNEWRQRTGPEDIHARWGQACIIVQQDKTTGDGQPRLTLGGRRQE